MTEKLKPDRRSKLLIAEADAQKLADSIAKSINGAVSLAAQGFADDLAKAVKQAADIRFRGWVYQAIENANHPDNLASSEFLRILRDACENETIKASSRILDVARFYEKLFADSSMGADVNGVIAPIGKLAISDEKSRIAKSKNADIKKFVAEQWEIRTDKEQTKAAFSRLMVVVINKKFGKLFGADAIARGWIPR